MMFENFRKILNRQSEDVFGIGAKKSLSLYSVFSVASILVPLTVIVFILASKLF